VSATPGLASSAAGPGPFPRLFSPLGVGQLRLRNRIVHAPHGTCLAEQNLPSERQARYYAERARGGTALIVMEALRVHPTSAFSTGSVNGFDPRIVPGLRRVGRAVHEHGAGILAQILHAGRQMTGAMSRLPVLAPSPIPCAQAKEVPHEMDESEIAEVVAAFGRTARLACEAGLDGVEIHGGHGYLIQQFLSPYTNRRPDGYGGSEEGRLRFALEVIARVRAETGPEPVVGMRISADEFTEGGLGLPEMERIARRLVATGALDYLSVSQSNYSGTSFPTMIPDMHFAVAPFAYLAAAIRRAVPGIPVVAVARINTPEVAERILAEGQADLVALARAHIADPEFALKAREGRAHEIRRCIACNQGCVGSVHYEKPITCLVNPAAGREQELGLGTLEPAAPPRRVWVIGGGPAGLEAARVAAARGHRITLVERAGRLGGQLALAATVPCRADLGEAVRHLAAEVERCGVEVRLGVEATAEMIEAAAPDAVIVATGSAAHVPPLALDDGIPVMTTRDLLAGASPPPGPRVLLYDEDGHFHAAGVAEHLADLGREVEVVTPYAFVGLKLPTVSLVGAQMRLRRKRVRFTALTRLRGTRAGRVILVDAYTGEEDVREGVDAIVLATGSRASDALFRALRGRVAALYQAGDAVAPRTAVEAVREGHLAGRRV
jgi:mycofactocin system FadH/OYE family oxidoreductase 2